MDREMDAIRPIRALLRGLETLEALNRRDGLTVSEVAGETGLPRTTAYRILETLCWGGFAVRDDADDRYRPTLRVRGLADGYADEAWIREVAKPEMDGLCRRILWPLMLSTAVGQNLVLRHVTDRMSPLALERYAPGQTLSLTASPAGVMRLADSTSDERDMLLDVAAAMGASETEIAGTKRGAEQAETVGYALDLRPVSGEAGLAVPVRDGRDQMRAIICMRFIRSALTPDRVVQDFLPHLQALAGRIGAAIPLETADAPAPASNVTQLGAARKA